MVRSAGVAVVSFALACCAASAQNPSASNPQALSYAAQSIGAMLGSVSISDVTLTGTVTWNGSDAGTASLRALGTGESRVDLALASGTRTEIRDVSTGLPRGQWVSQSGVAGPIAYHNCATDAVWFFPALGSLAAGPNTVLSYVGQESRNGATVQHLQSYIFQSRRTSGVSWQQLSTTDFYLDATTLLPVAITYNAHPDNDATTNLAVEVDFSNYQTINGVAVPMRIQRYLQGSLLVDVTVSTASFNTGLTLSTFAIN